MQQGPDCKERLAGVLLAALVLELEADARRRVATEDLQPARSTPGTLADRFQFKGDFRYRFDSEDDDAVNERLACRAVANGMPAMATIASRKRIGGLNGSSVRKKKCFSETPSRDREKAIPWTSPLAASA